MKQVEERVIEAERLWQEGAEAEANGEYEKAYELYTRAHDLVIDCARMHRKAHEKLRVVNFKLGNYGELATDWLLHFFAPVGVFEMVSYFSKTDGYRSKICKQSV